MSIVSEGCVGYSKSKVPYSLFHWSKDGDNSDEIEKAISVVFYSGLGDEMVSTWGNYGGLCTTMIKLLSPIVESDNGLSIIEKDGLSGSVMSGEGARLLCHSVRVLLRHAYILDEVAYPLDPSVCLCTDNQSRFVGCTIKTVEDLKSEYLLSLYQ